MKKYIFFIAMLVFSQKALYAQIKGKIYDAISKEAVIGATIKNLYGPEGTFTDQNGVFELKASNISKISIQSIGYSPQELTVIKENEIIIGLEPSMENLQQMVVTGNREAALRTQTPIAISKLTPKQIDEAKATSIYEVINKTPGVMMVNLNNEQHSMSIRQPMTTNAYYLYMEDGVPIRPMGVFNHNALLEMNQFTVSSVEVVKGPVSSIYGPEAVGGAINFISQRPTSVPTARIGVQFDQWGYKRVQYGAGGMIGKFGFYLGGLVADQKDAWMNSSDYSKNAQYARLEYHFSPKARLVSTISYSKYDSQTSGSVDSIAFYNRQYVSTTGFTYRKAYSLRTRLTFEKDWANGSQSFITAFGRDNKHGQNPSYQIRWTSGSSVATGQINSNDFQSLGIIAQHTQKLKFLNSKAVVGTTIDYSPNDYWAYQIDLAAQLRADKKSVEKYTITKERPEIKLADYNANIHNTAIYAQYDFEPIKNLRISAGLRFDNMAFDYTNNLDIDKTTGKAIGGSKAYSQTTPKLGLTYDFGKNKGIYANYSKGFAPSGLTAIFRKRPKAAENGDMFYYNLVPATFKNTEIGGWISLLNNKIYLDGSLYQLIGTNELLSIRQPDNSTDYQAAGRTMHKGIEMGLTFKPSKQVFFRYGGTYAIHKFDEFVLSQKTSDALKNVNGKLMPSAPKWLWNTELTYYPSRVKNLRSSIEWQHVGSWYQNQINTIEYKGYDILNFRIGYKWKGIELYSNIINLTDALYATNATRGNAANDRTTFTPAAPRTLVFGIQYNISGKK
ncbi:MAG: TonB-dependent receptor [Cytophagaceae bacterium]|nr:TonB-dependent receptor [Cytophagaceae bacterium]MBK9511600.1 TonB-dependent receptor [Cytophagaceae bacterium]MBL0301444.1 TonB-dependent receptor [Cytophagaceae bacterium]MBL0324265.1 TonB-dependent receptor [Cytophagaceae bacterium]